MDGYKERLTLYELIKRIIDDTGLLDMAASIGEQEISAHLNFWIMLGTVMKWVAI